jgi:hypothetical protein
VGLGQQKSRHKLMLLGVKSLILGCYCGGYKHVGELGGLHA